MKLKYLFASCILGAGLLSSCADEFKDITQVKVTFQLLISVFYSRNAYINSNRWIILHGIMIFRVLVLGDSVLLAQVVM